MVRGETFLSVWFEYAPHQIETLGKELAKFVCIFLAVTAYIYRYRESFLLPTRPGSRQLFLILTTRESA